MTRFFRWRWARVVRLLPAAALPILPAPLPATCLLPETAPKPRLVDTAFQHETRSPGGFFVLRWNSEGDSALASAHVPRILAALDFARATTLDWPGAWDAPLGPREAYPVLAVPQNVPGATSLPFREGGVDGLSWIQLDNRPERWSDDPGSLLDVVCAHEWFHALQFAQGADLRNLAFYEASAVWAEDQVFPAHDDWVSRYLPAFLARLEEPLDAVGDLREYGEAAVVKHLLAVQGGWEPCRDALLQGSAEGRCWPLLLDALTHDPQEELAGCLASLLRAGQADSGRRVPELALVDSPSRDHFQGLGRDDPPPAGLDPLGALGWRALPFLSRGVAWVQGEGVFHLAGGQSPSVWADSTLRTVTDQDWLLLVDRGASDARLVSIGWSAETRDGFAVWPNPGGRLRQVEFSGAPHALQFHNLLGQELGRWDPPGPGPGPFWLELPACASGSVLAASPSGARAIRLTVLHP